MILSAITLLLPILFVMGLGYIAGRAKKFGAEQVMGLNELVLVYALPALMFVGTVTTTRTRLLAEAAYLLGVFLATIGLFAVVVLVSAFVLRHSLGEAAVQANLVTFPSVVFFGRADFYRTIWFCQHGSGCNGNGSFMRHTCSVDRCSFRNTSAAFHSRRGKDSEKRACAQPFEQRKRADGLGTPDWRIVGPGRY